MRVDRGTGGWQKLVRTALPKSGFRVISYQGLKMTHLLERKSHQILSKWHQMASCVRSESTTGHMRVDRGTGGWQKLVRTALPKSGFRVISYQGLEMTHLLEREWVQKDPEMPPTV